jgi:hypothetical protein
MQPLKNWINIFFGFASFGQKPLGRKTFYVYVKILANQFIVVKMTKGSLLGQMSVSQMSVSQMSVSQMSVSQMSAGLISAGLMSAGQMSVR